MRIDDAVKLQAEIENGLFEQKKVISDGPKWPQIQDLVRKARTELSSSLDDAESTQEEALGTYYEAVNKTGPVWRFSGLYAGHLWIFLVGVLVSIFFFYYFSWDDIIKSEILSKEHNLAIGVVAWGIIGSILRCLWWLRFNVGRSNYRKGWRLHYISAPFLGGILGAIVYILIFGGLVSVSNQNFTPENAFAMIPIAAFAGFNWEWAVKLFKKIEKVFDTGKDDKPKNDLYLRLYNLYNIY